jgi:hypothetical protein
MLCLGFGCLITGFMIEIRVSDPTMEKGYEEIATHVVI